MKDTAVLLLAGGVGSRLSILVSHRAKPAVPFGGMYRIIDFTLSNIANSGFPRAAVLTQYKPLSLMDHIGDGSAWGLSGRSRGVKILPPKTGEKEWDWYKGTADAVRQNLSFITAKSYRDVLVLSGDHIYYMDYRSMLQFHRDKGAKVAISMLRVPWEETSQLGTGVIDEHSRIVAWEEKSPAAKSNLASMGIYAFDRDYLVALLEATREEDFGHHIIPKAIEEGSVFAYLFAGYWRDAGTIQAYWDANMDLLNPASGLNPEAWHVMTNLSTEGMLGERPPIRIAGEGRAIHSAISAGCIVQGRIENSVLSPGVIVEKGALVKDSVIMHDSIIRESASVERSIIDKNVRVGRGVSIGRGDPTVVNRAFPEHISAGFTLIGKGAVIPDGVTIGANCLIHSMVEPSDFLGGCVNDGETVPKVDAGR